MLKESASSSQDALSKLAPQLYLQVAIPLLYEANSF